MEKKGSQECRVITDLSIPHGESINERIPKGSFLGESITLKFAKVDNLAKGKGCLLFKQDLRKAYRRIRVDPGDMNALGLCWDCKYDPSTKREAMTP